MPKYKVMTVKLLVEEENVQWDVSEALNELRDDGHLPIVEWVQEGGSADITEEDAAKQFERPDLVPHDWIIDIDEVRRHRITTVRARTEEEAVEQAVKFVKEGEAHFTGHVQYSVQRAHWNES